jgi:hypothetical protein
MPTNSGRARDITGFYRVSQSRYIGAIHEGLEFRPALVAVSARQDTLRIAQCKTERIGRAFEPLNLGHGGRLTRTILGQQLLGLFAQLFQARLFGQPAGGINLYRQNDLPSVPVVRVTGGKKIRSWEIRGRRMPVGSALPADTVAPVAQPNHVTTQAVSAKLNQNAPTSAIVSGGNLDRIGVLKNPDRQRQSNGIQGVKDFAR